MATFTVNLANNLGAVTYRGIGFLHGFSSAQFNAFALPLKGRLYRNSNTGGAGNIVNVDITYPLVTPQGAVVDLVMSDSWANNATFKTEAAAGNYTNIDPVMSSLVTKYRDKAGGAWNIGHDIHNEPNHGSFWSGTAAQFYTYWAHAYALIRTARPSATIVGPSIATVFPSHTWTTEAVWLKNFLAFCNTNTCLPDRVSWHELGDTHVIMGDHIDEMNAWMDANITGGRRPIEINEIMSLYDTSPFKGLRPADVVNYAATAEKKQVFGVCKSSWDTAPSMDGCLDSTPATRSAWWAFERYAQLTGGMRGTTTTLSTLDGMAAYDGTTVRILCGNNSATAGAHTITVAGLPGSSVVVSYQLIADSGTSVMTALPAPVTSTVAVSGGVASVTPTLGAWGAVYVTFVGQASESRRATTKSGGVAFFPRLFYDSGASTNFADSSVAALDLGRYGMTHYLNYQYGPQPKAMAELTPLAPLGMFGTAVGNAFAGNSVDAMSSGNGGFAVVDNPLVSGVPFRTAFANHAAGGLVYLADEPNVSLASNILQWRTTYHTDMPTLPTLFVLLPEGPLTCVTGGVEDKNGSTGFMEHVLSVANPYWWMRQGSPVSNEWMGEDPYPVFKNETNPTTGVGAQGGYPNFWVADRAAHTVAAATLYDKIPILILQLFTGLSGGRFPTVPELWSHMTMAVAEGIRGLGWWQIGTNTGLRDQVDAIRLPADQAMIDMTQFLKTNEAAILTTPVTGWTNSTRSGTALAWRQTVCPIVANAIRQTSFQDGGRVTYIAEANALAAGVTAWSPMLDQNGNVRMRVFQKNASTFLVFAYNYLPTPISGSVTFTAPLPSVGSVTVIGENRTIVPQGASWTDTFEGSSSLNQTARTQRMAHIYQVSTVGGPVNTTMPAAGSSYTVSGSTTLLTYMTGPTLVGFVYRR